jgi:hypothetical protein
MIDCSTRSAIPACLRQGCRQHYTDLTNVGGSRRPERVDRCADPVRRPPVEWRPGVRPDDRMGDAARTASGAGRTRSALTAISPWPSFSTSRFGKGSMRARSCLTRRSDV